MLTNATAIATVAVRDLANARDFYEGKLGLSPQDTAGKEAVTYKTAGGSFFVYVSQFAGGNRATAVTWRLGADLEETLKTLASKGIAFEHYDMPGVERRGDIHIAGDHRMAWFKDPDGNIHGLMNG